MNSPRFPLLLGLLLWSAPAWAQVTVEPSSVTVAVPQGEAVVQTATLTNGGSEPLSFCLSFDRPLQQAAGMARLGEGVLGAACGAYGDVLALADENVLPEGEAWDPYGATMTPDGRLFVADYRRNPSRTHELTPDLQHVRSFDHPVVDEVGAIAVTTGVAYNADTGTLWWLNIEDSGLTVARALLLEGDLDGVPTGRRIELPVADTAPPPYETGSPVGLAYDASMKWYYYTDVANNDVWAVDTLGNVVDDYPIQPEAYPGATLFWGINVLPDSTGRDGAESDGLRLELYINPPGPTPPRHLGVIGRFGEETTPGGAEPLEMPLPEPLAGTNDGGIGGEPVRSMLDPNGVLYYPWGGFQESGVVAVRPHPLPPSWLVVEAWDGALALGESREVVLTFRPGQRAVGEYTAVLQAFEATSGAAVEVPLVLTVTEGTDAEDETAAPEASSLLVYPNPSTHEAMVSLTLDASAETHVVVYDVLGRDVAVLHDGPLVAGTHRFKLIARRLPPGLYLVRAVVAADGVVHGLTRKLVLTE